tara:strand:- start:11966 stop:12565 length:600 start_codon:yes stop_codon:yes gene_type:complete
MSISKYKVIGLTGGIGSGKTFVSNIFIKLGIPVFNADQEAKNIMHKSLDLKKKIENAFGHEVYQNHQIQKKVLSKLVFNNKNKLELLNSLVHPYVLDQFNEWCLNNKSSIVIKESAILFESNTYKGCDKIICVNASEKNRISRVIKRDNVKKNHVQSIMNSQMNQAQKIKKSDFIVSNNDTDLILPQVIRIINSIKSNN